MTTGKYILNDKGEPEPINDLIAWAKAFESMDRRVAITDIGEASVSTVFLGLDHNFGMGKPLLFETMVFRGQLNGEEDRYSTRAEALEGHEAMVAKVKAAQGA